MGRVRKKVGINMPRKRASRKSLPPPRLKRFNGRIYNLDTAWESKRNAKKKAEAWRKANVYTARISKHGKIWAVYTRRL